MDVKLLYLEAKLFFSVVLSIVASLMLIGTLVDIWQQVISYYIISYVIYTVIGTRSIIIILHNIT